MFLISYIIMEVICNEVNLLSSMKMSYFIRYLYSQIHMCYCPNFVNIEQKVWTVYTVVSAPNLTKVKNIKNIFLVKLQAWELLWDLTKTIVTWFLLFWTPLNPHHPLIRPKFLKTFMDLRIGSWMEQKKEEYGQIQKKLLKKEVILLLKK